MKGKRYLSPRANFALICLSLAVCLFAAGSAIAQSAPFTYQGRLTDSTLPANGTYEMRFTLYDSDGNQVGSAIAVPSVTVTNGVFTVVLEFDSPIAFNGDKRRLEIAVKKPADPGYTTLTPRQPITWSPLSMKTLSALEADALSTSCVGCVDNAKINTVAAAKITGTVANATNAASATTAGNVTGIVAVANGGTGSATQNFVDLTTNQTVGGTKTFSGTIAGNGSGLTNVPGTFKWNIVAGTSQQAVGNNGYVANSPTQVTITLPVSPNVGDTIRIAGAGEDGWLLAQNAGQRVLTPNINSTYPTVTRFWHSVASSSDGIKLVAAVTNGGLIYTSTDSGVTWTPRDSARLWESVASSADGNKLVAGVNGGQIYTSTDSGVTWTPRDSDRVWFSVASSSDGTKLAAGDRGGQIYTSTDSGVTWFPRNSNRNWYSVASSSDGTKLVAVVNGGLIYTSTDSGVTWFARDSSREWNSVASSSDGTKVVAVANRGQIYTSTDSGVTWFPRESINFWKSVASSSDGSKLVAVASGGQIYTSTDSGVTWFPRDGNRNWYSVASSADGTKLVAVVSPGQTYTSTDSGVTWTPFSPKGTTPGVTGNIIGLQSSALELIYVGGGQFLVLSQSGTLSAN